METQEWPDVATLNEERMALKLAEWKQARDARRGRGWMLRKSRLSARWTCLIRAHDWQLAGALGDLGTQCARCGHWQMQ